MTVKFFDENIVVTKTEIMASEDAVQLQGWYARATDIASDIQVQLDAFNDAIRPQHDPWFIRACGALNANRMVSSWARRRMLDIGIEPKRPASDPLVVRERRARHLLRICRAVISKAAPGHEILTSLDRELNEASS